MRASQMHRRYCGRIWLSFEGWRARDDARHFRDRGRRHRHVRRGDHRELTTGHIAPNRLHRDVLVSEDYTRHRLNFDVQHRVALCLRKVHNLCLRELDIFHFPRRDFVHQCLDLRGAQTKGRRCVLIEFFAEFAHCRIATRFDVLQRRFNDGACFRIVVCALRIRNAAFQVSNHEECRVLSE